MLLDRAFEQVGTEEWVAPPARVASAVRPDLATAPAHDAPASIPARYGEGRRFSPAAIGATVLVHLALAGGLLALGVEGVHEGRERLTVVDLALDTPPPPPPAPPVETAIDTQVPTPLAPVPVTQPPVLPIAANAPSVPETAPPPPVAPPAQVAPPPPAQAAPAAPGVVTANDLDTRMIAGGPPSYPIESRRKREQGTVELLVVIGTDGRVETISVSRSSGFERLDKAALAAVRKWRWSPTVRDGMATKVRGIVPIPFQLQGVN